MYNLVTISICILFTSTVVSAANLQSVKLARTNVNDRICINDMCNSTTNYPEAMIFRAVSRNSSLMSMFGTIIQPTPQIRVWSRFGGDSLNMCPSTKVTYPPRIGKNIKGEEKTIVNIDGYTQYVTSEICDENAKCFENSMLPHQDHFECQTHSVIIRLVVYNADGKLDIEHFPIPSGCYCSYKTDVDKSLTSCNDV